ncbi:hypothetical protein SAMN05444858_12710 [Micromonospora avicenniae]|uniref:Uncharacterized protein n=1 Tax=Micromonospora avicenniae TaxID=1198245 RepID=A0A1N7ET46_9ACTN|nr:hypothetical protein SAMN05444858_12710 [Micromonospora avicenniae]
MTRSEVTRRVVGDFLRYVRSGREPQLSHSSRMMVP